jgi:hypothetical protein
MPAVIAAEVTQGDAVSVALLRRFVAIEAHGLKHYGSHPPPRRAAARRTAIEALRERVVASAHQLHRHARGVRCKVCGALFSLSRLSAQLAARPCKGFLIARAVGG